MTTRKAARQEKKRMAMKRPLVKIMMVIVMMVVMVNVMMVMINRKEATGAMAMKRSFVIKVIEVMVILRIIEDRDGDD